SQQYSHRPGQSHPPPLLTSESTNETSAFLASTGSSAVRTLPTPIELPLEHALPTPLRYSQKSSHMFENQLPSLRPPSLSPQSTWLGAQQSAESILAILSDCTLRHKLERSCIKKGAISFPQPPSRRLSAPPTILTKPPERISSTPQPER
ncbi:hypothetical protein DL98DRAFT_543029, partial [Cadophora sp. DSE1049]